MLRLFHNTVSALCYDVARAHGRPSTLGPPNHVTSFVLASWAGMPVFLAWPIRLLTVAFAVTALFTAGAIYHRLDPERRAVVLETWRISRWSAKRNLVRFYTSLATLAVYSDSTDRPAEVSALEQLREAVESCR